MNAIRSTGILVLCLGLTALPHPARSDEATPTAPDPVEVSGNWTLYLQVAGGPETELGSVELVQDGKDLRGSPAITGSVVGSAFEMTMDDGGEGVVDHGVFSGTVSSGRVSGSYIWYGHEGVAQQGSFRLVRAGTP